jgi:Protein of unknown function (DUF1553)
MNPRLVKELRALLLPFSVAAGAGILIPLLRGIEPGSFTSFIEGLIGFTFLSGLLGIAAMPWGSEFQQRTLPLLLSQPVPRSRIWKDKLLAAFLAIGVAVLVQRAVHQLVHPSFSASAWSPREFALTIAWGIPTLCSVSFWTLLARSTIGGMVFTVASGSIFLGIFIAVLEQFGISNEAQDSFVIGAGVIYSALFYWLGWRMFLRFETGQLLPDVLAGSKSLTTRGLRSNWLRCRRTSGFLNLIRKEIQLQRPLFIVAAVLIGLWLLAYLLLVLQPSRKSFAEIVFALSFGFYVPLIALLAGCISLGEEKNLGLTAWQLSFPISVRQQWAVKFAVGFVTWLLLGAALPFALIRLGNSTHAHPFGQVEFMGWLWLSAFATAIFALSFWAMTLFGNTVRAVIATLVVLSALLCAAALAYWLSGDARVIVNRMWQEYFGQGLVTTPEAFGMQPYALRRTRWDDAACVVLASLTVLFALVQSFTQFRRLQTSRTMIIKYAFALIAFTFFETLYCYLFRPFS